MTPTQLRRPALGASGSDWGTALSRRWALLPDGPVLRPTTPSSRLLSQPVHPKSSLGFTFANTERRQASPEPKYVQFNSFFFFFKQGDALAFYFLGGICLLGSEDRSAPPPPLPHLKGQEDKEKARSLTSVV